MLRLIALNVSQAGLNNPNKKSAGTFFFSSSSSGKKQVHLESCVKPTVTKRVQSVQQSKQAVQPTEPGHRSTVTADMLHIHYLTTLGTFNTSSQGISCGVNEDSASVPPNTRGRSPHLYWQAVRGTTKVGRHRSCTSWPKKDVMCNERNIFFTITLHCLPVSYIYKPQYWQSVLPDFTEQCDRKCMNCKVTELKPDMEENLRLAVVEEELH